jgi:hypothetical protein
MNELLGLVGNLVVAFHPIRSTFNKLLYSSPAHGRHDLVSSLTNFSLKGSSDGSVEAASNEM